MEKSLSPDSIEGKVILVAGAAGFIPSTLAEFYLKAGAHVIGLDNFCTGSKKNIEILTKYENFRFYEVNIYQELPDLSADRIDFIFNMASPASPKDFKKIPLEIMRVNSEGTLKLLELAKKKNARILEASTSEVYGNPQVHPQTEDYVGHVNPVGVRACYDESKRFAEALTMTFFQKYHLETRIVRIFNTYGPRMRKDDGRVIPNFINQALRGEDITVYGDGKQTRSFCFVEDLIRAIHGVMFVSDDHTPFNVGNSDEYTILDVAKLIIDLTGSSSKIVFRPMPEDDPSRRRPDLSKVKKVCDFNPEVKLKEGLLKTIDFFKSSL